MSFFTGLTGFTTAEYHSYSPESDVLKNVGLVSYSRNSLNDFGKINGRYDKEILDYFGGSIPIAQLNCDSNYSMMFYDSDLQIYELRSNQECFATPSGFSATSLAGFQVAWDKLQKSQIPPESPAAWRINYTFQAINTSMSGCLTSIASYSVLGVNHSSLIRIYFFTGGRHSEDRKVAFNGVPTMVVVPRDVAGQPFSHFNTSVLPPGASFPVLPGGPTNPDNSVAAEPLYRFDNVTGKVEFGTMQLLARLLEDLDGSKLPPLPQQSVDPATNKPRPLSVAYEDQKIKGAPTADAMPLQSHNGNPKEFGPNSYDCVGGTKQKIKVVNLTPRKYNRGELVMCSLLNGMWVPMGYATPDLTPQEVPVVWRDIQKYVVDSEGLFRENDRRKILYQNNYEEYIRNRFYVSFKTCSRVSMWASSGNNISQVYDWTMNNPDPNQVNSIEGVSFNITKTAPIYSYPYKSLQSPNEQYRAVYDTDVLGKNLGGLREQTLLRCTNAKFSYNIDGRIPSYATTFGFGMYFVDGYTVSSISKTKSLTENGGLPLSSTTENKIFGIPELAEDSEADYSTLNFSATNALPLEASTVTNIWQNTIDHNPNYAHFPAQLGIHGSGDLGILNCDNMFNVMKILSIGAGGWEYCRAYFENKIGNRHEMLKIGEAPAYGFVPVSPHKIQFNSLGTYSMLQGAEVINRTTNIYNSNKIHQHLADARDHLGKLYVGYKPEDLEKFDGDPTFLYLGNRKPNAEKAPLFGIEGVMNVPIPFGEGYFYKYNNIFVRNKPVLPVAGGVGLFPANQSVGGAYVYGVISARGTFKGGEGIRFTIKNNWGINVVLGSESFELTFDVPVSIGGGAGLSSLSRNSSRKGDSVFYGSPEAGIDQPGGLTLIARVYDHCENVIYDGRYGVPFFFNPDDETMDFTTIKNPAGTIVSGSNYNTIQIVKNPIRRGQMLNIGGFSYIKRVITADITIIEERGEGYVVGDKISFGGSPEGGPVVFEVISVNGSGGIISLKVSQIGSLSPGAFSRDKIYGSIFEGGDTVTKTAKVYIRSGKVVEILAKDYPPAFHGEAILTADDNEGYGAYNKGWNDNTKTTTIKFSQTPYNNQGLYDVCLMFINDAGAYPENNNGGIDSRIPDPFPHQFITVEMNSI